MDEYPRHFALSVQRELRRIGADLERLGGLATAGGPRPADFLRWLRTIPGGTGHDAFLDRLNRLIAHDPSGETEIDGTEAPDAATFVDPEIDEMLAYAQEFDRVVPPGSTGDRTIGYDLPRAQAHALTVLRGLPDGAGLDAYFRALEASGRDRSQP